jgi:catechol 2,3-dioxygenase-like lactoylglutathione lyase family enzyme
MARVTGVDVPAVVVADMDRATDFYCGLLGMVVVDVKGVGSTWDDAEQRRWRAYHERCVGLPGAEIRVALLQAPDGTQLELIEYRTPKMAARPWRSPAEPGSAVISFRVGGSERVVADLREAGVDVLGGPVEYVLDGVRSRTTYLHDPDGNVLCLFEVVAEPRHPERAAESP